MEHHWNEKDAEDDLLPLTDEDIAAVREQNIVANRDYHFCKLSTETVRVLTRTFDIAGSERDERATLQPQYIKEGLLKTTVTAHNDSLSASMLLLDPLWKAIYTLAKSRDIRTVSGRGLVTKQKPYSHEPKQYYPFYVTVPNNPSYRLALCNKRQLVFCSVAKKAIYSVGHARDLCGGFNNILLFVYVDRFGFHMAHQQIVDVSNLHTALITVYQFYIEFKELVSYKRRLQS